MNTIDKILIIDDDPIANYLHQLVIRKLKLNAEILVHKNGSEALKFLLECLNEGQASPQLILIDINMPVMDGFDFLTEYKKLLFSNHSKVQLVALTTSTVPRDLEKMKSFGVTNYITKPLNQEKLQLILESHRMMLESEIS
jgi:CheY-like chemotaxis protein